MTRDADDDALSWGDDDPSHVAGPDSGARAVTADDEPDVAGSAVLVGYGILAGVALLYTVGWWIAVQRDTFNPGGLFATIMYELGHFLAIASPLVWFAAVFALVRRTTPRILCLIGGAIVLVPWPFVLGG